jgi:hypothetical protein
MVAEIAPANVGEWIVWAAGIVGGIAVMFRFFGTYILKPYSEAQLDKMSERLKPLQDELEVIRREVTYNSGSSLKDAVRRIEREQDIMKGRFEEHDRYTHRGDPDDMEPGL